MKFFVIRHKPSGNLLPARVPATKWDFINTVMEPRLFRSAATAKAVATMWSQGAWDWEVETESDGWDGPSYSYQTTPFPREVKGRSRADLEVVECSLMIGVAQ